MFSCDICLYSTYRVDNFKRHQSCKSHKKKHDEILAITAENDVDENEVIYTTNVNEVSDETSCKYVCAKCAKTYKTKKCKERHEEKCIGVDSMTCPRCMKRFKHQPNKFLHMKNNKCKPVSIFEYLKKNESGKLDDLQTKNIFVNNYGKERVDYITYDDFFQIIKCCNYTIIPKYVKFKHFNPDFPENHNIKCKNNIFMIKTNDEWHIVNTETLSNKLYDDSGYDISYKCHKFDDKIKTSLNNIDTYEDLKLKTNSTYLEVKGYSRNIKKQILDVIKTAHS